MRDNWLLDPQVTFLNHGSFGACLKEVLARQHALQEQLEGNPVRFMEEELPQLWAAARATAAKLVGASEQDLVFVYNATEGVNAVVRSLDLRPGDELLTTNHVYSACHNALRFAAERAGARVVVAEVPFPVASEDQIVVPILAGVTPRTRLALVDHVTSATGTVFPVERIVRELSQRGVDTLVDGAHAPGMLPVDLEQLQPAYYAGNFHKWCCTPKGVGMLYVRSDLQDQLHPLVTSHGWGASRAERFQAEFAWTGTKDPSAHLCLPLALDVLTALGGSLEAVMRRNHDLALRAQSILSTALDVSPPVPPSMVGSLAALPLPARGAGEGDLGANALQRLLRAQYGIEVLVAPWPHPSDRVLRVSAQLYNRVEEYQFLASVLPEVLALT